MHRWLMTAALGLGLGGCTANFWSLRTGVLGGETEGDVETALVTVEGCNDLTVYATNEDASAVLTMSMTGPLAEMYDDRERLQTFLLEDTSDFSLTLQTGRNLFSVPCADMYSYYYGEVGLDDEPSVRRELAYVSGDLRLTITAKRKRWDYYDSPVHVKLWMEDVVLEDPQSGEVASIPSALLQAYVWQWYWF